MNTIAVPANYFRSYPGFARNQNLRQRLMCYFFIREYNSREQEERKTEMSQERRESQCKGALFNQLPLGVKST